MPYSAKWSYDRPKWSRYECWDFVLPTGEQMNPSHPEGAVYFDKDQVVYVMRRLDVPRTRPSRVITSFGRISNDIGDKVSIFHDQTGAFLGDYELVGIREYTSGRTQGEVPDRLIPHSVFK